MKSDPPKSIVFYTDNRLEPRIAEPVRRQLRYISGSRFIPIIAVSLYPIKFGYQNIVLHYKPSILTMFRQILAGLEQATTDIVFLCEHDVLYHESHFDIDPPRTDTYYYNVNVWKYSTKTNMAMKVDDCKQTSGLCAYRELLLEHYRNRLSRVERDGFSNAMGFEPGTHGRPERVDDYSATSWRSIFPNIDIRHEGNLTPTRYSPDEYRNKRYTQGWTVIDKTKIPGWEGLIL